MPGLSIEATKHKTLKASMPDTKIIIRLQHSIWSLMSYTQSHSSSHQVLEHYVASWTLNVTLQKKKLNNLHRNTKENKT